MYACLSFVLWTAWIKGDKGENCEQVCKKQSASCDASKQSELTSYIAVAAAFKAAGYICKSKHEARFHAGAPFSTGRELDDCAAMVSGQRSSCDENQLADHSTLCYCRSLCVFFCLCVCASRYPPVLEYRARFIGITFSYSFGMDFEFEGQLLNTLIFCLTEPTAMGALTEHISAGNFEAITITLAGDFGKVIGEGKKNKQKFLNVCTHNLSRNGTRNLECTDVRPGSIVISVGGARSELTEVINRLKNQQSLRLEGFGEINIAKLDVIKLLPTTTKHPGDLFDTMHMVVICVALTLVVIIVGILICACCKHCNQDSAKDM